LGTLSECRIDNFDKFLINLKVDDQDVDSDQINLNHVCVRSKNNSKSKNGESVGDKNNWLVITSDKQYQSRLLIRSLHNYLKISYKVIFHFSKCVS
jgi:hypothetical protein